MASTIWVEKLVTLFSRFAFGIFDRCIVDALSIHQQNMTVLYAMSRKTLPQGKYVIVDAVVYMTQLVSGTYTTVKDNLHRSDFQ